MPTELPPLSFGHAVVHRGKTHKTRTTVHFTGNIGFSGFEQHRHQILLALQKLAKDHPTNYAGKVTVARLRTKWKRKSLTVKSRVIHPQPMKRILVSFSDPYLTNLLIDEAKKARLWHLYSYRTKIPSRIATSMSEMLLIKKRYKRPSAGQKRLELAQQSTAEWFFSRKAFRRNMLALALTLRALGPSRTATILNEARPQVVERTRRNKNVPRRPAYLTEEQIAQVEKFLHDTAYTKEYLTSNRSFTGEQIDAILTMLSPRALTFLPEKPTIGVYYRHRKGEYHAFDIYPTP